ncbi:MAG TPA: DEAD/DEAH box helicase, partial [Vicinamibacterales bacterium]|nr:DEAD/DEAH box helicase [Vicinamibacterales bacterium]
MARDGVLELFHPAVAGWFRASFSAPTPAQAQGWPAIARGESTLILAPTGSGKTLAAFLWAIERVMFPPSPLRGFGGTSVSPERADPQSPAKSEKVDPQAGQAGRVARVGQGFSPDHPRGARILYISPLKALAVDVERNLRAPIAGIANQAAAIGEPHHMPAIAVRTGDTPAAER